MKIFASKPLNLTKHGVEQIDEIDSTHILKSSKSKLLGTGVTSNMALYFFLDQKWKFSLKKEKRNIL